MNRMWIAGLAGLAIVSVARAGSLADLAAGLDSPNPAQRLESVKKMALEYPEQSATFMLRAAEDTDDLVRERAVQALGISGVAQAAALLEKSLGDRTWFVRWRSVQGLARLGAHDITPALAPLAQDPSWQVRVSACELLGDIAVEALRPKSRENSQAPADNPARSLLLKGLADKDERVELAAASQLARIGDAAAYQPLVGLLGGGSLFTRDGAALSLGTLGDKRAIGPLIDALADPRNETSDEGRDWARWGAVKALTVLTGQNFQVNAEAWRRWYSQNSGH